MGLSLRKKGLVVVSLAFAVQLAVLWVSIGSHVRHVAAQRRSLETVTTVNRAQSLLTSLVDSETGVRGFVIARRDAFLEPYLRARRDMPTRAAELVSIARADPQQASRARRITEQARALIAWQDETIALARAAGLGETVLARAGEGKRQMDAIRREVAALLDTEQRRLATQQTALEGAEERTASLMIAGSLLSVAVLMGVLLAFNRGIGRRLAQMVANMERFARGEPLAGEVRGVDEIAQLDRALRQMAAELTSRRLARMQALADAAGLAVSGQRSRDELLQATSERARTLLSAEHAEVWLPDATDEGARLRRLGEVGAPLICPEELRTRLQTSKRAARAAHEGASWLGAPFLNSSVNLRGVLAVARRNSLPFTDEDEQVLAQLAQIASAIFEIRQAYDALEAHARELALVNEDLAQKTQENELFVYSVSHDLRSPLVNLEGFSRELQAVGESLRRLLEKPGVSPAVRRTAGELVDGDMAESIHFIGAAVERLSRIIDGLLQLSRAGRVTYRREVLDVTPLAQRVVSRAQRRTAERGAVVTIAPYLGAVTADPDGIEQVLSHLLDNALKYLDPSRPGRIEFDVPVDAPAALHVVSIRDNGLGVAHAYQDKIFQPLQRVHVDAAIGEGLGLTIVRRILDRMGGHVWMESEAGSGSTFFVALPAAAPASHAPNRSGVPVTAIPAPDGGVSGAR